MSCLAQWHIVKVLFDRGAYTRKKCKYAQYLAKLSIHMQWIQSDVVVRWTVTVIFSTVSKNTNRPIFCPRIILYILHSSLTVGYYIILYCNYIIKYLYYIMSKLNNVTGNNEYFHSINSWNNAELYKTKYVKEFQRSIMKLISSCKSSERGSCNAVPLSSHNLGCNRPGLQCSR